MLTITTTELLDIGKAKKKAYASNIDNGKQIKIRDGYAREWTFKMNKGVLSLIPN